MANLDVRTTRRLAVLGIAALGARSISPASAAAGRPTMTVYNDPNCGCCSGWIEHLRKAGFAVTAINTARLNAVKTRLGVPSDLAACHTAEIAGYIVEGHVPASAIDRLLAEKPRATGLAVPGMPIGSPGMEGGTPEAYDVVLFGPAERRAYMRFVEDRAI
jgi:hypothetical protein